MKIMFLFLALYSSTIWAGQVIQCHSLEGKEKLQLQFKFKTDDLSGYAKFLVKGEQLFTGKKHQQDSCRGFAMRSRKYFNSFNIHSVGCDIWHCTLFTPDTIHGEPLENFKALFQCFPADSDLNHWEKANVRCSTFIE